MGRFLIQKNDFGQEHVVAYILRRNNTAEANYLSYKGETLAAVWAIIHFRPYFYGKRFTLETVHQPLRWLMESYELTSKPAKRALLLQEYDFKVVDGSGITNPNADGLLRNSSLLDDRG